MKRKAKMCSTRSVLIQATKYFWVIKFSILKLIVLHDFAVLRMASP